MCTPAPIIHTYYEVHRSYLAHNQFNAVYEEIKHHIQKGSGNRFSGICIRKNDKNTWTPHMDQIRTQILASHHGQIDYALVDYYHDETAFLNWHSMSEATHISIYHISIGHVRRCCLRNKETHHVHTFDLYDGDLFIMKVGYQQRFEHCIKLVKSFHKPCIHISFCQTYMPTCYFIYDPRAYQATTHTNNNANTHIIYTMKPYTIQFGQHGSDSELFEPYDTLNPHIALLASNLQKAIRRQEKEIALHTTMNILYHGGIVQLLRRLSIITWEDVILNVYYPAIVWLFVAISSKSYQATKHDIVFIYSYVAYLCEIDEVTQYNGTYKKTTPFAEVCQHTMALSLHIRIQYGGFSSELCGMNDLIRRVLQHDILISQKELTIIPPCELVTVHILDAAIDFHCFPSMLKRIQERIPFLTEESIKKAIWNFDSNINRRIRESNMERCEEEEQQWKEWIQPACTGYRKYIKKHVLQ